MEFTAIYELRFFFFSFFPFVLFFVVVFFEYPLQMAYSRVKAEQLGGMILLEPGHKIIHDTVSRRLGEE